MVNSKTDFGFIKDTPIEQEMQASYLDYAMSVIVARALPDIRDGLKPVQRRILYAMHDLGMRRPSSYKKSARLVGEVLGKYHPHGDSAVYEAMVRMAQPFSLRMPLVDGQGNFGSVDGDSAAAMRYTEARLSQIAEEMLINLEQNTVDFIENFDGSLKEPVVIPARLPNLLVNGASGIAVGMATNIPPHNLSEVCNAVIKLIENPEIEIEELIKSVRGPDFPTGGTIMGKEGIINAYTHGKGSIIVRGKSEIEQLKNGKYRIIISELPFQVNKASLVERIAEYSKSKRIEGISEIRDESDRDGMRIVLELRSGSQPLVVQNNLFKYTALQSSFSANMLAIVNGIPQVVNLKVILEHYLEYRKEIIKRKSEFELAKARERAHILAGLRIALSNLDEVIQLIRESKDSEEARNGLITRFGLDEKQSQAILEMQLRRIAALERERLENEYKELQVTIKWLEELLGDVSKILNEIKDETLELKKKFGGKRLTDISYEAHEFDRSDLEPHEQIVITLSKAGYIKRIPASTYRNQHRGGKGVTGMNMKEDDPVEHILVIDTHDRLLFFTNTGRVLSLTSYELRADTARNTRGVPIANVIALKENETVRAVFEVKDLNQEDTFLIMATRTGKIEKVPLQEISSIRLSGLIVMNLKPKDELVSVRLAQNNNDLIMVSEQGMSIRFSVEALTSHHRGAGGVRGMKLREKDKVIAMNVGIPESRLLVISKNGYAKVTPLENYRTQNRGGTGVKTSNITKKTGVIASAQVVSDDKEVYIVSKKAQIIRTNLSEIRSLGRITQGVRIFNVKEGDSVSCITCVDNLDDKPEDNIKQLKLPLKDKKNNK